MKYGLKARIGIVGAGPAGLTAAETLRAKGYTDITLLERSERAGGKCHSIQYEGRSYELGAGIVSDSNRTIRDMAKKFGVEIVPVDFSSRLYLDVETGEPLRRTPIETLRLIYQILIRYRKLALRYRVLAEPGLSNIDKDLCVPFSIWAKQNGIELLAKELANYFTGFGYGFFDEVPAAYVLKYYPWEMVRAFVKRTFYKFPCGIQGLWDAVAKDHHVIYGTTIKKIERGETVAVNTDTQTLTFDALILTAPLDEALRYLDASKEETALFTKILHEDYRTYACLIKGFPKKTGYIPANLTSSRKGHPVLWYQRYPNSGLYTFYVFGDDALTNEDAQKHIRHVVTMLGGTLESLHVAAHWKFFPHVNSEDMRDGYFDTLENLQGTSHTYYAGELLNFSTVDQTASYAKKLVERFF